MATNGKGSTGKRGAKSRAKPKSSKDSNRCWPGYEPVPGKAANEEGSCRPKAASKLSPKEKDVRARRRKQLDRQRRAGMPAKQRSARRHATPPPKGVSQAHRRSRRRARS